MLHLETGPDTFAIYLDKVLIMRHSHRQPLFLVATSQHRLAGLHPAETRPRPKRAGRRKVTRWQVLRNSPDSLELDFPAFFNLIITQVGPGSATVAFKAHVDTIEYLLMRIAIHPKNQLEGCSPSGLSRLPANKAFSWQSLQPARANIAGGLLRSAEILPGSGYRALESVAAGRLLFSTGHGFVRCSSGDACCAKAGHQLLIETVGLPHDLQLGHGSSRRDNLRQLHETARRPQPLVPGWLHDGLCVDLSGGNEAASRRLHRLLDAGIHVSAVLLRDWAGCRQAGTARRPTWQLSLDQRHYANLAEDIDRYRQADIHTLGYLTPYLDASGDDFEAAKAMDWLVHAVDGSVHCVNSAFGRFAFWDLWKPQVQDYLKQRIEETILQIGMHGWLADYGSFVPPRHCWVHGMAACQTRAEFPALWARLNAEAAAAKRERQPVVIMRDHPGIIAETGLFYCHSDARADWSRRGLAGLPAAAKVASALGAAVWFSETGGSPVIGGKPRSRELLQRWLEFSALTMVLTGHEGQVPARNSQLWDDDDNLRHTRRFTQLFRLLKPYREALLERFAADGVAPLQSTAVYYPSTRPYRHELSQFMLGEDLLAAPSLQADQLTTAASLPDGRWVHLWSSREFDGGDINIESPVGYPALFFRAASSFSPLFEGIRQELAAT